VEKNGYSEFVVGEGALTDGYAFGKLCGWPILNQASIHTATI
jgi:hypothetical protein